MLLVHTLVDSYNYIGTIKKTLLMRKKTLVEQYQKEIYTIYNELGNSQIPFDSHLNVFNSTVSQVGTTSGYHQWVPPVGITILSSS